MSNSDHTGCTSCGSGSISVPGQDACTTCSAVRQPSYLHLLVSVPIPVPFAWSTIRQLISTRTTYPNRSTSAAVKHARMVIHPPLGTPAAPLPLRHPQCHTRMYPRRPAGSAAGLTLMPFCTRCFVQRERSLAPSPVEPISGRAYRPRTIWRRVADAQGSGKGRHQAL
jgi:hypothetical protein